MFKKSLIFILAVLFCNVALMAEDDAEKIIQKHLKAINSEKSKEIEALYVELKMNAMGMEIPTKMWTKGEDKYRTEVNQMGQNMIVVLNGDEGWVSISGMVQKLEPEKMERQKKQMESNDPTGSPFDTYIEDSTQVELVGKEMIDNVEHYNIKMTKKDGKTANAFISTETYFITKITMTVNYVEMSMNFKDYKSIDGMIMASTIEIVNPGQGEIKIVFEKIEINKPIDDGLFDKP